MTWAFENARTTIVVRQLTGAIARRIVGWADVGHDLRKKHLSLYLLTSIFD